MSSPTYFKLAEPNGVTRRVAFPGPPTWEALASKIGVLYGVPVESVSVAYLDSEGDQITLSSQDELDDFYRVSYIPSQIIKFTVQDLSSIRGQKPLFETLNKGPYPFSTDAEDDWQSLSLHPQPLAGIFGSGDPFNTMPHAFLEVVNSDIGNLSNVHDDQRSVGHSTTHSPESPFLIPLDKGKYKASIDDDAISTASILAEDAPLKHPVHVYDISSRNKGGDSTPTPRIISVTEPPEEVSTLKTKTQEAPVDSPVQDDKNPASPTPDPTPDSPSDPPLASLNATVPPSLSNDVASFLNAFNNAITGHPELSEGIRNIVQNAANGTYWAAHRETISYAAQEFVDATEQLRRDAEAEAAKRVAEALGGILQSLSQVLNPANGNSTGPAPVTEPPSDSQGTQPRNDHESQGDTRPSHVPFFNPHWGSYSWGSRMPPPPPFGPPPFHNVHRRMGLHGAASNSFSHPPPPPPPPPPPVVPGGWGSNTEWLPPMPPLPPMTPSQPRAHELKAHFEAVKAQYKAEKQKYRLEREQLRRARDDLEPLQAQFSSGPLTSNTPADQPPRANVVVQDDKDNTTPGPSQAKGLPTVVPTPAAIAVQGRRGNPTLEVVSVHRNNTFPSHRPFGRHPSRGHTDFASRTTNRILRRLADMGFTEQSCPTLATKIRGQLPRGGVLTNEDEDNVVTNLLEELLAMSPKPHGPPGEGENIPGAWD